MFPWATYGAVVSPRTRPTAATIESKRKAIWGSRMSRYHERCPIWRTRVWSEGAMSYSDVDNLYLNKPEVHEAMLVLMLVLLLLVLPLVVLLLTLTRSL